MTGAKKPLWTPEPAQARATAMHRLLGRAALAAGHPLPDYEALWQWSVDAPREFWSLLWDECGVVGERGERVLENGASMPGARWFPEARLNFAENLLRHRGEEPALVFTGEDGARRVLSRDALRAAVAAFAAALTAEGVGAGDRVAALLPNVPEAIVALLACATIGAIFTSASPDFGVRGVLDRFAQVEPRVLVAADGYRYDGKLFDIRTKVAEIAAALPSLRRVVLVPVIDAGDGVAGIPHAIGCAEFVAPYVFREEPRFAPLPFDHPLCILYSSGTTGVPKCIVHGAGGTLLQHLKEQRLHCDLRPGDRLFYFTTLGWMMWNWLVSGLASGATLLLYDGSPFARQGSVLFDLAERERCTHFGVGAKFLESCLKAGLKPRLTHDLSALRVLMSTGSPLSVPCFEYVYRDLRPDLLLASISGGTDIVSCFVLGNPLLAVWPGEIQCRGLGMAVDVVDAQGLPVRGEKGELVCDRPFPSMPIAFWNDIDGSRYRAAYFERFPGRWCHGDYAQITAHGGIVIHGRSDATLNPGGVRIGTAEIYAQVENVPEVLESLAIAQPWGDDVRVVLFVCLRDGLALDEPLRERIRRRIREHASPRHVPARIVQVPAMPRTRSGKLVELAVRDVVAGREVGNLEAIANPGALEHFRDREELRH
ncbi:MAG: Acetyl-coenzyme A synthetase [Pseudomonadales bacterium]|nr:Acetyl-coenzyme A synthetase [Pseudomonadales bacterium]